MTYAVCNIQCILSTLELDRPPFFVKVIEFSSFTAPITPPRASRPPMRIICKNPVVRPGALYLNSRYIIHIIGFLTSQTFIDAVRKTARSNFNNTTLN